MRGAGSGGDGCGRRGSEGRRTPSSLIGVISRRKSPLSDEYIPLIQGGVMLIDGVGVMVVVGEVLG